MKLKKTMAAALAAAMLASAVAAPAFAAGSNTMQYYYENDNYKTRTNDGPAENVDTATNQNLTTSGTTKVKYEVHTSYEWSIPSVIDFGSDAGVGKTVTVNAVGKDDSDTIAAQGEDSPGRAMRVTVSKNVLEYGKYLIIRIGIDDDVYERNSTGAVGSAKHPGFFITSEENQKLYYTIHKTFPGTETPSTDGKAELGTFSTTILEAYAGRNTEDQGLIFKLNTENERTAELAGTYTNTLTFTAAIEDWDI